MFIPEYLITPKTLKSIALFENCKGIIDTTTLLPAQQKQLKKDTRIKIIGNNLRLLRQNIPVDQIKKQLDKLTTEPNSTIANLEKTLVYIEQTPIGQELTEESIKELHRSLTKTTATYRTKRLHNKPDPQEILAHIVEVIDWVNSLEARETHPLVVAAINISEANKIWFKSTEEAQSKGYVPASNCKGLK
jgi:hypothetical protein